MSTNTQAVMERQSRVGKRSVTCPKGVTIKLTGRDVAVQGPKGQLNWQLPDQVSAVQDDQGLSLQSSAGGRDGARLQGLARALIANMVKGVAVGYERVLEFVGTGYRCEVKGSTVSLQVGLSHPAAVALPKGVTAVVPGDSKGAVLILSAPDKAVLGQLAATIRGIRPPEPYAGKGIRYRGEVIVRKAGKAGKGRK